MESYDVTIRIKVLCLYLHDAICFSKFHKVKFGNLVEMAVKGLNVTFITTA